MGTVKLWPEPLIDHLRWAVSQPWQHRWRQLSCVTRRGGARLHLSYTPFKGWLPLRKALFLEIAPFGVFLWAYDTGEHFIYFLLSLSNMIILPVIQPVKYQPNCTTLLIVYLLTVQVQISKCVLQAKPLYAGTILLPCMISSLILKIYGITSYL